MLKELKCMKKTLETVKEEERKLRLEVEELRKIIKLPRILEYHKLEGRYFILYEFIAGENFSNFLNHTKIKANHIIQIAETLAKIHSFKTSNQIEKLELPPFENWYNFFLSNEKSH